MTFTEILTKFDLERSDVFCIGAGAFSDVYGIKGNHDSVFYRTLDKHKSYVFKALGILRTEVIESEGRFYFLVEKLFPCYCDDYDSELLENIAEFFKLLGNEFGNFSTITSEHFPELDRLFLDFSCGNDFYEILEKVLIAVKAAINANCRIVTYDIQFANIMMDVSGNYIPTDLFIAYEKEKEFIYE